jgi:NADH dehydrogenase/NADH:ubiquinone oxidoreductase subunit G
MTERGDDPKLGAIACPCGGAWRAIAHGTEETIMKTKLSRRAALAGLALAPTAGLAATTTEVDPIFTVIEKHREAWKAFAAAASAAADVQVELVNRRERSDENAAYVDAQAGADGLGEVAEELKEALLETQPPTLAGALAAIRYVNGYNCGHYHELFEDEEYATFLTTIGNVIEGVLDEGIAA